MSGRQHNSYGHRECSENACVLLVEPNHLSTAIAVRALTEAGHAVTHVEDGESALAELHTGDYDVLITAWELAGALSGDVLCRRIRADAALDRLRVLMLTSHDSNDHLIAALDAGADDFIVKPFHVDVFTARVRAAMRVVLLERERNRAIESLRRREAAFKEIAAEQAALRRVTATVARSRTPEGVFSLVAREVARVLGCDGGMVVRNGDGHFEVMGSHAVRGSTILGIGERFEAGQATIAERVARGGVAVNLNGASPDGRWHSRAGAPIHVDGEVWGSVVALAGEVDGLPAGSDQRVARFAELVSLAIANAQARQQIADLALRDPLTGLPNRRAFTRALERALEMRGPDAPLSLAIFDVDLFKRVNDTHGHETGDHVLVEIARRLTGVVRKDELIARLGGEEFVWLMPGIPASDARTAAERVRLAISGTPFRTVGTVTISAGVADVVLAEDPQMLYPVADRALYQAKKAGRNRTVVADRGFEDEPVDADAPTHGAAGRTTA